MVGEGEEQGATLRRDRAEDAVVELVGGIGSRFQEYVSDWIASFDAAHAEDPEKDAAGEP